MNTPAHLSLTFALILALIAPQSPAVYDRPPLAPEPAAAAPAASYEVLIDAGSSVPFTDGAGKVWAADQAWSGGSYGYVGGSPYTMSPLNDIVGTTDDLLYQTQRSNVAEYRFDVPNGVYEVELRFAEVYASCVTLGCRKFSIKAEGTTIQPDVRLYDFVGWRTVLNVTFVAPVSDNQLNVQFTGISSTTVVNALRVTSVTNGAQKSVYRLNSGWFDYTDSDGNFWQADQPYFANGGGYVGASTGTYVNKTAIANTTDDILFQTQRYWNGAGGYTFDVPSGPYSVQLLLSELVSNVRPGGRVFDVYAEGQKMASNVDPFLLAVGSYKPYTLTFTTNVLDSQLNITFTKKVTATQAPSIDAISIMPTDNTAPGNWAGFSPSGWVTASQTANVSMQVQDAESGLNSATAQVGYSTNGGVSYSWIAAAVSGSNGSTSPETISASVPFGQSSGTLNRVQFRISDRSGNVGTSPEQLVRIDTAPPVTEITSPAAGQGVRGASYTLQGTASDPASGVQSVEVSTDNGVSWQAASGAGAWSYLWALPGEGTYTVRARARDNAGWLENPGAIRSIVVDNVPPNTAISAPTPGQVISAPTFSITGSASDARSGVARVEVSVDGGATWANASGTTNWNYLWSPSGEGNVSIKARAVDNSSNVDTPGATVNVAVDRTPPTSAIISPTPGQLIKSNQFLVEGTASDGQYGSGLSVVEVSTDGSTWHPTLGQAHWFYSWLSIPGDGVYSVRSRARDAAGNLQTTPYSVTVTVDNGPPVTTASVTGTLGENGWYVSNTTVRLTASDAASGVQASFYRLNDGAWYTYTVPFAVTGNMEHNVEFYSVDKAGNSETTRSQAVKIDNLAPSTLLGLSGALGDGGWYRSTVSATLNGSDSTSGLREMFYNLDGAGFTLYLSAFPISGEGSHTLLHYGVDQAGNAAVANIDTVRIDTHAPGSLIVAPFIGQVISGTTTTVRGTAGDGLSGLYRVEISVDGAPWQTANGREAWTFEWSLPGDGNHTIRSRSVDNAGNVETPPASVTAMVDNARPSSAFVSPYNGQIIRGSNFVISGTATDAHSGVQRVELSLDGGASWQQAPLVGGVWTYDWSLPEDGLYHLRSRATDNAGNVEIAGSGVSVRIDHLGPASTITSPLPGQYLQGAQYTITGAASDLGAGLKRVEVSIDDGPWLLATGASTWSFVWSLPQTDGEHVIRSRATDNAGNIEMPGPGLQVYVDATRPVSTITSPQSGRVLRDGTLTILGTSSDATSLVKRVQITIQRGLDNNYWNGWTWAPLETWLTTGGTTAAWTYTWDAAPTVGSITVRSRATDNAGNVETPGPGVLVLVRRGNDTVIPIIIARHEP